MKAISFVGRVKISRV